MLDKCSFILHRITLEDAINLMTVHSAKGLEIEVFVINMAKEKFPLMRGGKEPIIPLEFTQH